MWKQVLFTIVESKGHRRFGELKKQHIDTVFYGIMGYLNMTREDGNMGQNNGSWFPADTQLQWIKNSQDVIGENVHIYRMEDGFGKINTDFQKRFGKKIHIGVENRERHRFLGWKEYFKDNEAAIIRMAELYKDDFERFGYVQLDIHKKIV